MHNLVTAGMPGYTLLDSGEGKRLERWGEVVTIRPDPEAMWKPKLNTQTWQRATAIFTDGWKRIGFVPEKWMMQWEGLKMWVRLTPFKHLGVFPEQVEQWEWVRSMLNTQKLNAQIKVLNLFGYTGAATLVCAANGANVTHVDASKPSVTWARENCELSGLETRPIRWIVEDVLKFCKREVRRGSKYDAIIMDPPAFGHGPAGEVWEFAKSMPMLFETLAKLVDENLRFVLVNAYAVSCSPITLGNMMEEITHDVPGKTQYGELSLQEEVSKRLLSTGIYARWERN
jgi:23S rRNA (cytosine1962-C5)-methyltransferase